MAIERVVYVWIGCVLPDFANESLTLTKKFNPGIQQVLLTDDLRYCENVANLVDDIFVIGSKDLNVEADLSDFWQSTKYRFDFLEYYMKKKNIEYIFHAEIDNVIMRDMSSRDDLVYSNSSSSIYCPMDYSGRFIFSVGWLGLNSLKEFNHFRKRKCYNHYNDMDLLSLFFVAGGDIFPLPSDPIESIYDYAPALLRFDAASVGQFLCGDIRGRIRYVNPRSFPLNSCDVIYYDGSCEVLKNNKEYTYFNLHIHSKSFESL